MTNSQLLENEIDTTLPSQHFSLKETLTSNNNVFGENSYARSFPNSWCNPFTTNSRMITGSVNQDRNLINENTYPDIRGSNLLSS